MNFLLHLLASIAIVYAVLSLLEYLVHRFLMHRPGIANFFHSEYLYSTFRAHMSHHGPCYQVFNHEEGACGLLNLTLRSITELAIVAIPALLIAFIDPTTAIVLVLMSLLHSVMWSAVHTEMHRPKATWFSRTSLFKLLMWLHFLHHRHPGTNFNALFLGWDWLLFTAATPTSADRLEAETGTWRVRVARTARA